MGAAQKISTDFLTTSFYSACEEWPGIFKEGEDIDLAKRHLQVCDGPIEGVRLLGSNLRIMDDAFEYLLPTEAKKKKGQFSHKPVPGRIGFAAAGRKLQAHTGARTAPNAALETIVPRGKRKRRGSARGRLPLDILTN
jgi:hypothetical protein